MEVMTKTEFYKAVADKTGMTQKDTKIVFEAAQEVVLDGLKAGKDVKMFDGVVFTKGYRPEHTARNPRTGENMEIPAKYYPKARFGKLFKETLA